ncbi:MAG: hypothetical protein M0C28_03925 [Candidatus Moduliflexus flocculans]|nr:hypothetical protein [Candidatus Moduliflexus flocculans]
MVYKKFRIDVFAARGGPGRYDRRCSSSSVFRARLAAAAVLLGLLAVAQIAGLFRAVDRTNRDLARFFDSVRFDDYSQTFRSQRLGGSFQELHAALARVVEAFRAARADKEEQALYLQTVVQHVGIGLVVFQPDGEIELLNNAAQRLLRIPPFKNVRDFEEACPGLAATLLRLKPRDRELVKVEAGDDQLQLLLHAAAFKQRGRDLTLVSIQDIRGELEEREIEAWQKLIRVLTHEIMNSMTPISSLAGTVEGLIDEGLCPSEPESLGDIRGALKTIQRRSEGLLHFVDGYRNLARLPKPDLKFFPAADLFAQVAQLLQPSSTSAAAGWRPPPSPARLEVLADPGPARAGPHQPRSQRLRSRPGPGPAADRPRPPASTSAAGRSSRSATTAGASPRRTWTRSSSPSSRPRRAARASASACRGRSCGSTAARSAPPPSPAGRPSSPSASNIKRRGTYTRHVSPILFAFLAGLATFALDVASS